MPSWLVKAAVQRTIGALPHAHRWNELLQTRVSRSLELTRAKFSDRLNATRTHLGHLRQHHRAAPGSFSVLEIGTGWHPVVPIGLWLCGAREVQSWDVAAHATPERLRVTLRRFVEADAEGLLQRHLPDADGHRVTQLRNVLCDGPVAELRERCADLGVVFRVGTLERNLRALPVPDLVTSYAVLEYLAERELADLLLALRQVSRAGTVMSHWIDYRDEYAYFDKHISHFNFLRFPGWLWAIINNPLIPLSRLRLTDHRHALLSAGFRVVQEDAVHGDRAELARVPLAAQFRRYPLDDLLALDAWLVAVPG